MCKICDDFSKFYENKPIAEIIEGRTYCNGCYKEIEYSKLPTHLELIDIQHPYPRPTKCNFTSTQVLRIWSTGLKTYYCPHCSRSGFWIIELCHDSSANSVTGRNVCLRKPLSVRENIDYV